MKSKILKKVSESSFKKKLITTAAFASTIICTSIVAFAAPNGTDTSALDNTLNFLADWGWKLGGIICFIGGIETAIGFKDDDSSHKTRGIRTLVAGAMVVGICVGYKQLFGI